jgi:hypothetical protein
MLMCGWCDAEAVQKSRNEGGYECSECGADTRLRYIEVVPASALAAERKRAEEAERDTTGALGLVDRQRQRAEQAEAKASSLTAAISEALFALIGGDGPPDTAAAQMWLRTTLPPDHPNYVARSALADSSEER